MPAALHCHLPACMGRVRTLMAAHGMCLDLCPTYCFGSSMSDSLPPNVPESSLNPLQSSSQSHCHPKAGTFVCLCLCLRHSPLHKHGVNVSQRLLASACVSLLLRHTSSISYCCCATPRVTRGNYKGPEPARLATLKLAALQGAPYIDVEYKAAPLFFAGERHRPFSHTF